MTSQAEKVQIAHGTLERNQSIIRLYNLGVPQSEIARQFTARGHLMSRQQVNSIIKRYKENNNGNDNDK
jgi:hypothetical protein